MKTINTLVLLTVLSLLPFLCSSCSNDDDPAAPVPTVKIAAGDVTDASLTFTVTAENATKAAWVCIKKSEATPTVEAVLTKGTSISASKATSATASNLEHNTDYVIVVAVEGEGGTASASQAMKTAKTPDPTVTLALEGEATETSFSFKVTAENATKCAYKYIKDGETAPTAAAILTDGTKITDYTKAVEVKGLLSNTKYVVYAAVEGNAGQALSEPLNVTTKQKTLNIEFTEAFKTGSNNNFYVTFSNNDYTLKVDFYTTAGAKYLMPGTYKLAGMQEMECDKAWTDLTKTGEAKKLFTEGNIIVTIVEGNTYEITTNLTLASGEVVVGYYKEEITGITVIEAVEDTFTFTVIAAKRSSAGSAPGEYYIKLNDANYDIEMTLDFYADISSSELPAGTYTLNANKTANTLYGQDSNIAAYKNAKFTTYFGEGSGTVVVTKSGKIYTFTLDLVNKAGLKYKGSFTGEIGNMDLAN